MRASRHGPPHLGGGPGMWCHGECRRKCDAFFFNAWPPPKVGGCLHASLHGPPIWGGLGQARWPLVLRRLPTNMHFPFLATVPPPIRGGCASGASEFKSKCNASFPPSLLGIASLGPPLGGGQAFTYGKMEMQNDTDIGHAQGGKKGESHPHFV